MALTPQERQRRSEQAKRMHREGKLGSPAVARRAAQRSVEVRAERASAVAHRLLSERQEQIGAALDDVLRRGTRSEKLKAIDIIMKSAMRAEAQGLHEAEAVARHRTREELLATLVDRLTNTTAGAMIRAELGARGVIDGTAVEAHGDHRSA